MDKRQTTLGAVIRNIRSRKGWTLKEMSEECAIPISTLTKVEHDRLTLTYDKLQQLSQRLGIRMSELFSEDPIDDSPLTRRSIGTLDTAIRVNSQNYDYYYLCTDLRSKKMIPMFTKVRSKSLEEFGALVKHSGEEFIYVLKGSIIVYTEHYSPQKLDEGQSVYIDSSMGHAYILAEGCEEALTVGIMAGGEEAP